MKEIIYNIDGVAGRVITLTGLTGTFTKNNVLGIINKSQGDVLYTPMDWNLLTFAYSNGTMTLTLAESVAAIVAGDKLFIKLYADEDMATEERIMGGKLPLNSGESVPAFIGDGDLSDVNDMNEDGELYAYSAMQLPETVAVGDVFTAGSFQEQTEGMFFLAKSANDPSLYYDGQDFSVSGITEKLEVQSGKSYIVTGVYELHYEDEGYGVEASGLLLTYDEYEQGRTIREVYEKIQEGSSGDAAEQVKDFFGIVKDGDTVKVVTEDGGEEIVEPVGLMDEDDVYDYLEDIAVLLGGITAQQAASITAATRAIIHGGSGSGEGGEGGSGSGSGE